ncbi:MAG: DUF4870 domain-containing protein [Methylotenera sp.]|jgi:hypothetical protein|uniref:DUF4870 domain-containing protein n=1 Tax=Methylotenera sp. TaxID=2051956 RepID=UPI00271B8261|nr:DUF4870 domain-containing protein [Methylotenera sp.]MDO9393610.1 DUF4870 domain-containing protein [Methylotenera sp.]MDP1523880.1 DUF4870 domain-containing protein [Methylotenera sp.]MDP3308134.1 DUF4870 domain-containing protein [Methylotenera sp.]MDP3817707.1 DUF4870 domain-containing protein [Methylotenera sp.]MDZ4210450.1 DUF4870 domain-containing protein [Methylotenera sp.]
MPTETNTEVITVPNHATPSNDDKNIATITHLGGTVFSFVPALIVWILKKDDSEYISGQAKEALNFQITVLLAYFISWVLAWILIGFVFMLIIWIFNIVLSIIAAISTSKGETYRYPFTLRLIN